MVIALWTNIIAGEWILKLINSVPPSRTREKGFFFLMNYKMYAIVNSKIVYLFWKFILECSMENSYKHPLSYVVGTCMPLQALGISISRMPGYLLAPFHKNRLHTIIVLIFAWQKKIETLLKACFFYLFLTKFLFQNMVRIYFVHWKM
jgi:hypothetical protein